VSVPNASFINLQNGTLFFYKNGVRFEKHIRQRLITYVLPFAYSTAADCPLWHQHLDRSLPEPDKQAYLAKCLALAFYSGKIEKAPCFWGEPDTGKSVTLDIFKALLGRENFVTESLTALTQKGYHGDYARARLDGKLACVASDISKKLVMTGSLKLS
jgi:phage/plasmid-associated DNA primase